MTSPSPAEGHPGSAEGFPGPDSDDSRPGTLAFQVYAGIEMWSRTPVAAVVNLHHRNAQDRCSECGKSYPCPTVELLSGEDT